MKGSWSSQRERSAKRRDKDGRCSACRGRGFRTYNYGRGRKEDALCDCCGGTGLEEMRAGRVDVDLRDLGVDNVREEDIDS